MWECNPRQGSLILTGQESNDWDLVRETIQRSIALGPLEKEGTRVSGRRGESPERKCAVRDVSVNQHHFPQPRN